MAVLERDVESALALLRLSARVDTIDANGMPPLFHAARDGNRRLVRALLAAGAGVLPKGASTSVQYFNDFLHYFLFFSNLAQGPFL